MTSPHRRVTSGNSKGLRSSVSDALIIQEIIKVRIFCASNQDQRLNIKSKDFPSVPISKGLGISVSGSRNRDQYIHFLLFHNVLWFSHRFDHLVRNSSLPDTSLRNKFCDIHFGKCYFKPQYERLSLRIFLVIFLG